jgi:hypothetical protein
MKLLHYCLAASLLANAALVFGLVRRPAAVPDPLAAALANAKRAPRPVVAPVKPTTLPERSADLAALLQRTDDLAIYRDTLRAAGFPEADVRLLVSARLEARYGPKIQAVNTSGASAKAWWIEASAAPGYTEREELISLINEEWEAERLALLGEEPQNVYAQQFNDSQYGFLPAEKRAQFEAISKDYEDMQQAVYDRSKGFMTDADHEEIRFLEAEKHHDLMAALTPEERVAHDMRLSATASRLRWQVSRIGANEQEYQALYALQKQFDERYENDDPTLEPREIDWDAREKARTRLAEDMRQVLGEKRHREYVRKANGDYEQLAGAARRYGLPAATPDRVFDLRDDIAARSQKIADEPTLSDEARAAAIKKLAAQARTEAARALGGAGAPLLSNPLFSWLADMENGQAFSVQPDGYLQPYSQPNSIGE